MTKEKKEEWLKETYDYLKNTDFDKVECHSDIYLDYIMLYEENTKLQQENKQLKQELEEEKNINEKDLRLIDKLEEENKQLKELYKKTCKHLFDIGNDELARYFKAQIDENNTFMVGDM